MVPWYRQPLVHFCIFGALFYAAVELLRPPPDADDTIRLTRAGLITFIERRSQIFQPLFAAAKLDAMSADELAALKAEYIEEEAMFRAATQLGLDIQDYVIRRRMVQKMDYAATGETTDLALSEEALKAYYTANQSRYRTPARLSFKHVFFSTIEDAELNAFGTPSSVGERFAYGTTFDNIAQQDVADIFGADFSAALMAPSAALGRWLGPIASRSGFHLVKLRQRTPATTADFAAVRQQVEIDIRYDQNQAARAEAIADIIAAFNVRDEF